VNGEPVETWDPAVGAHHAIVNLGYLLLQRDNTLADFSERCERLELELEVARRELDQARVQLALLEPDGDKGTDADEGASFERVTVGAVHDWPPLVDDAT
jgi:hypothetical protein